MSVSYDVFTGAFLSKVSEFDFVNMRVFERNSLIDGYMKRAIAAFRKICKYDLSTTGDDVIREFDIDIADGDLDELADIISEGMLVQWMKPFTYRQESLESVLNTRDFTTYSPAELLMRIGNAYKAAQRIYEYDEGVFVQPRGFDGLAYMMIQTTVGVPMDTTMLNNYFRALVNLFFKILPIKESGESSLEVYMRSLQAELLGCKELIEAIHDDPLLLSLIAILQYLIDTPECEVSVVKREVFRAISICNKLKARYAVQQEVS